VKMAVLRIVSGLSTYQKELALMGEDYQEIFAQQVREMEERRAAGLPPASWAMTEAFSPNEAEQPNPNTANDR
jgi:capsid protein